MHSKPVSPPRVVLPIQYLRAVAAMMVVWHHAKGQFPGLDLLFPSNFGPSGVDLFFVISGFIMVAATAGQALTPWQFLRRRIIRVVPLYWLLTLAMVALALVAPSLFKTLKVSPATLLQSLLFIPHHSQSFADFVWPLLVPGWTLNFEMFFYVGFALSLFLPRGGLAVLGGLLAALVVAGFALGPFESAAALTYTSPVLLEFVAGGLIAIWWLSKRHTLPLAMSLLFMAAGAALLVLRDNAMLQVFSQIVGAALVVMGALDARLCTWHNRLLKGLGDSSYSLYLTHIFTLGALRVVWAKLMPASFTIFTAGTFMLVSLLCCAIVGWLSYRWLETPMLHWLRSKRPSNAALGGTGVRGAGPLS